MIDVTIHFPDQAALIAFFTGKPAAPDVTVKDTSATVTPAKQDAARASTAAGKSTKGETAEVKTEVKKPTVDYPTLQKAVFDLVGAVKAKGLDPAEHVLSIAKTFGYDNFAKMKEAGPEGAMQFEPALAAVQAKSVEIAALVVEDAVA